MAAVPAGRYKPCASEPCSLNCWICGKAGGYAAPGMHDYIREVMARDAQWFLALQYVFQFLLGKKRAQEIEIGGNPCRAVLEVLAEVGLGR